MKLQHPKITVLLIVLFSGNSIAATYKCTSEDGKTAYQSSPCAVENKASELNINTGGLIDLSVAKRQLTIAIEQQTEEERAKNIQIEKVAEIKKQAMIQSQLNQQLIKENPRQFSPFAIPPYHADNLFPFVKQFENRLADIEKFRRLSAQKALATGQCQRVEADNLSVKSTQQQLVFSVDCSSAKTFFYTEKELIQQ